jgi:hypothetical protein
MSSPIRLTQEEYNRFMSIEHYASEIYDLVEELNPDWSSKKYSRGLYCHIAMRRLLGKP